MEDGDLVGLALSRPEAGFARMYDAYGSRLYDYCHGILRSGDEAADAVQDTFETAITRLGQLREPAKLRPWLYAIARNHCFQRTRKRDRERSTGDLEMIMPRHDACSTSAASTTTPVEAVEAAEVQALVWDAVGGLSDVDSAVLDLNVRHGLEGEELASALGVPASRAYVMVHRAKARLEGSVSALLVARAGTEACPELKGIVGDDPATAGRLTPLIRKRVTRHVRSCEVCQETERQNHPLAILALLPLVPAPPELRSRILDRAAQSAGQPAPTPGVGRDGGNGLDDRGEPGWQPDGFPRPIETGRLMPVARLAATAVGLVATLLLVAFAPTDWIPTIGGHGADPSTEAAAGPSSSQGAIEESSNPDPARPDADEEGRPEPTATTTTTTTSPESEVVDTITTATTPPAPVDDEPPGVLTLTITTTSTTARVLADLVPPSVSSLSVSCDDPFVLEVTVVDDFDPSPVVDLRATWDDGPGQTVELTDQGRGLYRAVVPPDELVGETIAFLVEGTVRDRAGNQVPVTRSSSCRIIG